MVIPKEDTLPLSETKTLPQSVLVGEQTALPKPAVVTYGIRLLYLSLVLSLMMALINMPATLDKTPKLTPALYIGTMVLTLFISFSVVFTADQGKSAARLMVLAYALFSVYGTITKTEQMFSVSAFNGVANIVQCAIFVAAACLLFLPAANAWYKSVR